MLGRTIQFQNQMGLSQWLHLSTGGCWNIPNFWKTFSCLLGEPVNWVIAEYCIYFCQFLLSFAVQTGFFSWSECQRIIFPYIPGFPCVWGSQMSWQGFFCWIFIVWDLLCLKACHFHYLGLCRNDCVENSSGVFSQNKRI